MIGMEKRFVLLAAYEDLTEKETFCIKEANFDEIRKVQGKKLKLLGEMDALGDRDRLRPEEKEDFNNRVERLQIREKENEERLNLLMGQNRSELKSLSKHASSVSQIRKAYGSSISPEAPNRSLKGKA